MSLPYIGHLRFLLYSDVVEMVTTMTVEQFILLVTKYQKKMFVNLLLVPAWEVKKSNLLPTDISLTTT